MQGNFIMVNSDDLRQIVAEMVEELSAQPSQGNMANGESEWLSREDVCRILHITFTTLWRKEKEGLITRHKIGRRNLYSKKEIESLFVTAVDAQNKGGHKHE